MKRALIFGIGDNFISQRVWLWENYKIVALCDNSPAKQGMIIDGLRVEALEKVVKRRLDVVVVTPTDSESMAEQLLRAGVPREKIVLLAELAPGMRGDRVRTAFIVSGGDGDRLIALNYIWHFKEKYIPKGDIPDIYYEGEAEAYVPEKYQLIVRIAPYPDVVKADMCALARVSPEVLEYVLQCQKFRLLNARYFERGFIYVGQASVMEIINGRKRVQQPDVYGLLGMDEKIACPISIDGKETECLGRFGVCGRRFLTFSKETKQPVKGWREERFDTVVGWVAENYPELIAVELAAFTDMEDRKILLKNSMLHIDTDSDNVHLRHALCGGPSIVVFGPTSAEFYGYSENHNITGRGCGHFCEGAAEAWDKRCLAGGAMPYCMETVTVEMVERHVREVLGERK